MDNKEGICFNGNAEELLENAASGEDSSESENPGEKKKIQFSGSCSFMVSLLGYSMGTSDFWRFPYLVFRNGGGAFLIPFAIFMMLTGLPMLFFEVTVSQFAGKGPMSMWDLAPFFRGIGYTLLAINLMNNVYYNVLRAWILEYFVNTFRSELPWKGCNHDWNQPGCVDIGSNTDVAPSYRNGSISNVTDLYEYSNFTKMTSAEQYWQFKVLQLSPGLGHFDGILWNLVLYIFIWRLCVALCMVKSIKSIEKIMFLTVFVPIGLMLVIWVRCLTLKGSVTGMLFYLTPTFDRITDTKVWMEAALMSCYTLGPGWGTLPLIGSHNKFSGNTVRYSVSATVCDILSAVINGLICFSILGVMSHDSGLPLEKTVTSGLSLGFTVYPTAFTYFPLPQLWSAVFFINLIFVGLDAQVLSTETVMNCLQDTVPTWFTGHRRLLMIAFLNISFFLLTIPFCTRGGMFLFQLLDWYAAAWTLLFVCFTECVVITWVYGGDRLSEDLEIMIGHRLPVLIRLTGTIITPAVILVMLVLSFIRYRPPTYGSYVYPGYAEIIGWMLAFAIISPIFIVFLLNFIRTKGSCFKKMCAMYIPSKTWGPNDVVANTTYPDRTREERTFMTVLLYNLTGRKRSQNCDTLPEISPLYKDTKT